MRLLRKLLGPLLLAALALLPSTASAQAVIAHRGVFHDVNGSESLPENSYWALIRAYSLGLQGAELDLRLDAQNNVAVTHDLISNRTTILDGNGGTMNAVDVALNSKRRRRRYSGAISSLPNGAI